MLGEGTTGKGCLEKVIVDDGSMKILTVGDGSLEKLAANGAFTEI